ncbi:hypothetical protein FB446DRAFT_709922, partial [Lentinula raphanica]
MTPGLFVTAGGSFTQRFPLPTPQGQVGFRMCPYSESETVEPTTPKKHRHESGETMTLQLTPTAPAPPETTHRRKCITQYKRWSEETIPRLVRVYLEYIQSSSNLADRPGEVLEDCVCMSQPRELKVVVVRFHAVQLMKLGLFGCAPLQLSLAVDLRVLDFMTRLNLRVSPNNTAWCSALQDFLQNQGYHLHSQDPLRRRFANALQWFNTLQDVATRHIDRVIEDSRTSSQTPAMPSTNDADDHHQSKRARHITEGENEADTKLQPSEYLRRRCLLCFGGTSTLGNDLSCIKNNARSHRDPERQHPRSVFIPESDVATWQHFVESVCPTDPTSKPKKTQEEDDGYEGSFTAADGARRKASTQFFDSTGLMGLLCRHNRVLWLVNITTPGERQHYALALIDALFQHLPTSYTVRLLYDIGCSLERSCIKWGFIKDYLPCIAFAISVFHAFGHNWPCQCIYHPRKCKGFGLSDGKGCEQFWHSISRLVPYLRVCGHYLRLYSLDTQIQHADQESLWGLATWIVQKWKLAEAKRIDGEKDVRFSMKNPDFLRAQWAEQVKYQTRPLPSQSRNAAKKAAQDAVRLRNVRDTLRDRLRRLEAIATDLDAEPYEVEEAQADLDGQKSKLQKAEKDLRVKERSLGIEANAEYRKVASSPFIAAHLNAKAVKIHLREKLKARKFERDRLEQSFRRQISNSERRLQAHTADAVKRRDPGIESLARLDENTNVFDVPPWLGDDQCDEELRRLTYEHRVMREWFAEEWSLLEKTIEDVHES